MKPLIPLLLTVTLLAPCRADSLFPGHGTNASGNAADLSLFADNKARRVGDTLTIVINENASAASQANTKTAKNESASFGPGTGPTAISLGPFHFGLGSIPALGLGSSTSTSATGTTNRTDNLTAQIAVTVMRVLPNGNLEVEGHRRVGVNAETQDITLSGIVRPEDIAANNTIPSPLVADAQIKYGGKGPVAEKQHDGIITRIFKIFF